MTTFWWMLQFVLLAEFQFFRNPDLISANLQRYAQIRHEDVNDRGQADVHA